MLKKVLGLLGVTVVGALAVKAGIDVIKKHREMEDLVVDPANEEVVEEDNDGGFNVDLYIDVICELYENDQELKSLDKQFAEASRKYYDILDREHTEEEAKVALNESLELFEKRLDKVNTLFTEKIEPLYLKIKMEE